MRFYRRKPRGPLWCDFWHGGERFRRSTGTTDERAAREYVDKFKAGLWRADRLGERPAVTWDAAVLDWLEEHEDLKALSDRKDQLRWWSTHLKGNSLATIDTSRLKTLARKCANEGRSDSTVNRYLAAVSGVLNHAKARGWLDFVPSIPRRKEPRIRLRWATKEQAAVLVDALPAHLGQMARFALATGLRRFNVTHLEWSSVDMGQGIAWIHADEAKGERTLSVPLNDAAMAVLHEQRRKHKRLVFPYQGRAIVRQGQAAWQTACKKAGLAGFRWHDLRHTWASWHVQNGTPLAVLQELGGWRSLSMVMRYAHLAPSHVAAYANNSGLAQNRAHGQDQRVQKRAA